MTKLSLCCFTRNCTRANERTVVAQRRHVQERIASLVYSCTI